MKLSVASVDPPELVAKLGEPKKIKDTLVHVPLTIEIPPGTPPMARLDIDQHDEARVVLKTTHPDVPGDGARRAVRRRKIAVCRAIEQRCAVNRTEWSFADGQSSAGIGRHALAIAVVGRLPFC